VTQQQVPWVGSATALGLFVGTLGQGEFTDRFSSKTIYPFNLLLFGVATIGAALAPSFFWLIVGRFLAGVGLGAE
jgi:MFS transporter, putative metabolite:H+ symporter